MIATIIDGAFFSSSENGLPILPGTIIEQVLPKMFASKEFGTTMETTEETVNVAANTLIVVQIIITLVLAASLKSMWNLMNVIQVLAYIRFYSGWPAFLLKIFEYMDNAITMKPVTDFAFDYG